MLIVDTDILSMFAKVNALHLLVELVGQATLERLAEENVKLSRSVRGPAHGLQRMTLWWKGAWRRVDDVAEELRRDHPQTFRKHIATLRTGETRTCWIFSKVVRLKRYGKLRLFIVHDEEDLSDLPQYLVTNALHWEGTKAIQTWSYRWTSEVFHAFGKQATGFESAQVRKEEAVHRHFRLSCVAQSILQRVLPEVSTSEKFAFADGIITCGQRLKAIAREVFHAMLTFARQLFQEGKSCQEVVEALMPA